MTWEIRQGDALERLGEMPDESVQCCVTSPPYWGLRDYGVDGQLGLEETPEQFVAAMVEVFAEVGRVLRSDGTAWLNIGDSYAGSWGAQSREHAGKHAPNVSAISANQVKAARGHQRRTGAIPPGTDLKPKDLVGIPWMLAFALRAEGWYLRRDIIWNKPNPMPESVTDRPTSAHEYLFLLTKSPKYLYDADAIREPHTMRPQCRPAGRPEDAVPRPGQPKQSWPTAARDEMGVDGNPAGRNKRSVWSIATKPFPDAHFATFPPDLVEPCIRAGTGKGDLVTDPFSGAATTGLVATQLGRDFVGIELNPKYVVLGEQRIRRWEADPAGHLKHEEPIDGQASIFDQLETAT